MIYILLILLVYIVGPIAILVWAYQRYKHGIKPATQEWVIVGIAIVLMVLFALSSNWTTTDRDQAELSRVIEDLTQRYDFPVDARFENRPAVDGVARSTRLEIHIYGVLDPDEQDKIAFIAEDLRERYASKPIMLHFIREEVWETREDGSRYPRRDREEVLRKVRID